MSENFLDRSPEDIVGAMAMNAPIVVLGFRGKIESFRLEKAGSGTAWELSLSDGFDSLSLAGYVNGRGWIVGESTHTWTREGCLYG